MIRHHPEDELLLALAAGTLDTGAAVVVAAHAEQCDQCRARLRGFEALGGALLDTSEPATLAPEAWARTLARLDAPPPSPPAPPPPPARRKASRAPATLPDGLPWPRALDGCTLSPWRSLGPGRRWSRITSPLDRQANLFLLRIGAGLPMPWHRHSGVELTQVLYGAFDDGRAVFGRGDFDLADHDVHHQPVVLADGECVCLATVRGKVLFDGALARLLGGLIGL